MKFLLIIIFQLIHLFNCKVSITSLVDQSFDDNSRVIGGFDAKRHQFPYMVSIHIRRNHVCGGSIVTPGWIVTAGHCCEVRTFNYCERAVVIAGILNQNELHSEIQRSNVDKVVIHPEYFYNGTALDNDIALLKLSSPLTFTQAVQAVTLPSNNQIISTGWLSGWGYYKRPTELPNTLQYLKMQLIENSECKKILQNFKSYLQGPLLDSHICGMPLSKGPETGCNGDSGGPIANNSVLIGVVSWGVQCTIYKENAPTVFTAVNKFLDFIAKYVV